MGCKNGRPSLLQDQDRQLFAESAGTCLLCNALLFSPTAADMDRAPRSISIAERAHIVAHSDRGPRADVSLPEAERGDPANIVLLCPTCHTKVDKAPDLFPAEDLLARKVSRAAAVARVGGTPVFRSRDEARAAVETILAQNKLIFSEYGPDPVYGSLPTVEESERWRRHVLDDIVPGNDLIVAIVEMNATLTIESDRKAAELLRIHTQDLAEKHRGQALQAPARRFPPTADDIFAGIDDARA